MAKINEAWRVLSDPGRRAAYDAESRPSAAPRPRADWSPPDQSVTPARFPWRLMVGVAAVGIAFVLVNAALTEPGSEPPPDNLMEVGSCVDILDNGDAKEVLCSGPNDGLVVDLLPVDSICPLNSEVHRDRQGMGDICVRLAGG